MADVTKATIEDALDAGIRAITVMTDIGTRRSSDAADIMLDVNSYSIRLLQFQGEIQGPEKFPFTKEQRKIRTIEFLLATRAALTEGAFEKYASAREHNNQGRMVLAAVKDLLQQLEKPDRPRTGAMTSDNPSEPQGPT